MSAVVRFAAIVCLSFNLFACGGGGSGGDSSSSGSGSDATPNLPPPSKTEASRFLQQSSFGADDASIEAVVKRGYSAWIDDQIRLTPSHHRPRIASLDTNARPNDRVEAWWYNAVKAPDQLRQRVAFALSEIFVVSDKDTLYGKQQALANYYDLLVDNAFGNFRTLMEQVTLSPVMGEYLSLKGNQKANTKKNIRPDENYARELMQLFTIGLVQLNTDGSVKLDAQGQPIPTYDQSVIEGFAQVWTGWQFANAERFSNPKNSDWLSPLKAWPDYHETAAKKILDGITLPAGQSAEQDLKQSLDTIFNHPNVAPFIGKQLIQRLVTSNPSPAYVARISAVFDDNGHGVRGDLAAVVKAILLDDEARNTSHAASDNFGKLKEPVLRVAELWRAFHAAAGNGRYDYDSDWEIQQAPLRANSVFNFFSPFYSQPGELGDAGLVSPEFQITTEYTITQITNRLMGQSLWRYKNMKNAKDNQILIDIETEKAMAGNIPGLIDRLDLLLLAGRMSPALRQAVSDQLATIGADRPYERVTEALALITTSPEFAVQQ